MTRRAAAARAGRRQAAAFVVVTGLSGAGKSHALRALEDLGYFCVDNLPVPLIETFADLTLNVRDRSRRAAVVVDVREGQDLAKFPAIYRRLKRHAPESVRLIFLDAADSALLRRFSETRRPHPLAASSTVAEGLSEERRLLEPVRRLADQVVDTSALTVHELRRQILEATAGKGTATALAVTMLSFGFRHGVPEDADLVFDVRFLPNPHFVPKLRALSGQNARVSRYVMRAPATRRFMQLTVKLMQFLLPQYVEEGKAYLTVAIGCTGGRHRSVAVAHALAHALRKVPEVKLQVRHRDVALEPTRSRTPNRTRAVGPRTHL